MKETRPARIAVSRIARRAGMTQRGERLVPEEVPIAFSYGGSSHAVMMATPADLEDFALGFSLAEGIVTSPQQILEIALVEDERGIDVQIRLEPGLEGALRARRRSMAGPVGCGLCGIESIEQAVRDLPDLSSLALRLTPGEIAAAVAGLADAQALNHETRAVHAAGFYVPGRGLLFAREDVGRHNALDKLSGAVLAAGEVPSLGVVAVTSRLSVEMVQKAAILGSPVLVAVSAPTALAIRTAEVAGLTLIAVVRGEDYEIFTHPQRVVAEPGPDRAAAL